MAGEPTYRQEVYDRYVSTRPGGYVPTATDYERWASRGAALVRGWLPPNCDTPILDVGCGPGGFLYLLQKLGYTDVTGVDISGEQVALGKQWSPRATFIHDDCRRVLALNRARYGLIVAFDVFEHFTKDELIGVLQLVSEALRPGGRLIVQTPNGDSPWPGPVAFGDFTHELLLTPTSLSRLLRLAGFVDFQARECGPHPHGVKSGLRTLLWKLIRLGLDVWNIAETGERGSGVYTRVFVASAVLPTT